jgi:hypothetical protein
MIIVEGMDNTGKTTLIETLAKHFNLPTVKSYRPFTREDIYALHSWISAAPQTVITDRHPSISDLVYGPTIRGSTPSSLKVAKSCRMNNYLIFCRPPTDNVFGTDATTKTPARLDENGPWWKATMADSPTVTVHVRPACPDHPRHQSLGCPECAAQVGDADSGLAAVRAAIRRTR